MDNMDTDFIYRAIDQTEEFTGTCRNCNQIYRHDFLGNGGFICTGIVRHPLKKVPFDVIRQCTYNGSDYFDQSDYAPDEALLCSQMLAECVRNWLESKDKYLDFRKSVVNEVEK